MASKRKRNPLWHRNAWLAELDPDDATVIVMRRDRRVLEEVGAALSVTREAVRQREARIAKKYGWEVFDPAPGRRLYNIEEAIAEVKRRKKFVGESEVVAACEAGEVEHVFREGRGVRFLLTERGLRELMRHRCVTRKKACKACSKIFIPKKGRKGTNTCSPKCRRTWRKRKYEARGTMPPDTERMYSLHRTVLSELQELGLRPNDTTEQWLFWRDALDASGITAMQFSYLTIMGIILVKRSETKTFRGEPARMYSAREMVVVRRVFERFNGRKRSKK